MGQSQNSTPEQIALPCDRRYRTSQYFLQDQLRCSEAAEDFRSVKTLLANAVSFGWEQALQFQPIVISANKKE